MTSARAASARRRRRVISKGEILDAALTIVDREGLAALSMRRLAEAADIGVMTLYGFFESKDDLVSQLGTHAMGSIAPAPDPALSWRDQLKTELGKLRTALREHPGLIELLGFQDDEAPSADRQRDGLLGILRNAGIDDRTAVDGLGSLVALTLGFAVGARARNIGLNDHAYERLGKLSPDDYPHLTAMAGEYAQHWSERAFEYGVNAVLDTMDAGRTD
ncbi:MULTISPECIES: TetR/AcrR family transcriptional regulator [Mycobacterium]|uniref:TetR family transcriptional regulator n=1 Tax=Mycobacterium kiyosense TaxID=2871094 RepID=A0A9P3Q0L4_9MYCO|nr:MULTISPECIES: TetR/AcrR family transcriptional regulator [Mycobacterium]BDB44220.1 TetR family transcriptional regulator [Mycobacterium kiyosense]BDE15755.1 TetR family transcriptional regulator [Mycobacterium sp. 20KCMC460]GLB80852.1 TetR family transcriptional regulator [Mycobacterium kiyosense]GLB87410.1 TetR family transcriptional regulator [Mycobacterium kiyosense]GLB93332.1 TetR family transcriptional regulator [Mycobacterium kiyosense]